MRPRIPRAVKTGNRRPREGMSERHKVNLRACPCIICGRSPAGIVHHLLDTGEKRDRGMGRTEADRWGIPLCHEHHDEQFPHSLHREGAGDDEAWFARYGIDSRGACRSLWRLEGDLEKMIQTVEKIRAAARLKVMEREYLGL